MTNGGLAECRKILNELAETGSLGLAPARLAPYAYHTPALIKELKAGKADYEHQINEHKNELSKLLLTKENLEQFVSWASLPFKLQKNDCSRIHQLADAFVEGRVTGIDGCEVIDVLMLSDRISNAHTLVVQHDWDAFIGQHIELNSNEIKLPFPVNAFEFVVNARCIVVIAVQAEGFEPKSTFFVNFGDWWIAYDKDRDSEVSHVAEKLKRQVFSVCIAIDADVATHQEVTAPQALNKKRMRFGKRPLMGYHIIDLAKNERKLSSPAEQGPIGNKKRLHFRRGHWRHYEDHTTWIKWMLVGNPDLGFVDKEYRI